ncbi:MAG: NAD(P)-dependent alcohol dehydrogenase [Chloroflexota bacterium]
MKAFVYHAYGGPEKLKLVDLPKPSPSADQVLIKIKATSINLSDWETLQGAPLYSRIGGLREPATPILGSDVAGIVEAVGADVRRFKPGDRIFGDILGVKGGFAEYVAAPAGWCQKMPQWLSFEEAAALPQAVAIAHKGICITGNLQPGQHVLINGAGGGSGSFAIQWAKHRGGTVTAVDSAGKLDFMRQLGADHVIDYQTTDFTRTGSRYDLIIDMVAYRSPFAYLRALAPKGACYIVGGAVPHLLQALALGPILKFLRGRKVSMLFVNQPDHGAIDAILPLIWRKKIRAVIDKTFPFDAIPEAIKYHGTGKGKGKVIIQFD